MTKINQDWREAVEYQDKWVAADKDTDQPVVVADNADELYRKIDETKDIELIDLRVEYVMPPGPSIVRQ